MSALMDMHVVKLAALTCGAAMPLLPVRAAFMVRSVNLGPLSSELHCQTMQMLTEAVCDLQGETGAWRGTHCRG